ncbi:homeobox transcription factor [Colletotrichum truncatum]|uniref:Homeobox transcription factor n=1 Tax=Colletotrichum truncatum TaxID=5467 RepID=A0ACC3Z5P4_COLTU|nr:homeobox transcription factor [Colletotrichum truncatum]KAF6795293.1 homeobox transcription factor [Colletotrichum truncatum]
MPAPDMSPPASTAVETTSPISSCDSLLTHESITQSPARDTTTNLTEKPDLSPCISTSIPKTDMSNHEPEKHPKGKRKRTAAKDKTILENAYLANPKPDKAARLDIVKRVSLNEKEVQIWFQNRRQNDRRKSRPLSAQEIAALRYGGMQILSSDPVTYSPSATEEKTSPATDGSFTNGSVSVETPVKPINALAEDLVEGPQHISPSNGAMKVGTKAFETPASQVSDPSAASQQHSASFSLSSSVSFLANQWYPASSFSTPSTFSRTVDDTPKSEQCTSSSCEPATSATSILPLPQSHVRLSLSLEGKAELVANEASSPRLQPSKLFSDLPSLPQVKSRPFQRSHSALPSVTLPPISALTDSLPPTLGRGRSRDAHAWELCCDADARDELTTQAENESNGSAVAAISLLRSTSGILQNNTSKRNSPATRPTSRPQQAKKPKLSRTSSSVARMQTALVDSDDGVDSQKVEKGSGKTVRVDMLVSPSGDSDKENWFPDDERNPRRFSPSHNVRRPLPATATNRFNSRRTGRLLQDHPGPIVFGGNRSKTMPMIGRRDSGKGLSIFEDEDMPGLKPTDEVERFMRGEISPSKKGDMDCIAGLLSLSQGNWR